MDLILSGLSWECCLVFVDDIVVFSNSFDEHVRRLGLVLDRLRTAGLKLRPSKCKFFQRRVVFLGHVISGQGVEADPSKVSAVLDWPTPPNVAEVRTLLGWFRAIVRLCQISVWSLHFVQPDKA